jgi:hypothetical protein
MATLLLPAGSANAATSATCGANSTQVVTGGLHPSNKVWIDGFDPLNPQIPSRVVVCVTLNTNLFYSGGLAIVFDAGSGVITPPAVAVTYTPTPCGSVTPQWNSTSPNLALLVNPATLAVCIRTGDPTTHADVWTSVQFASANVEPGSVPTLEGWTDGGTNWGVFDILGCPVEYVLYLRQLGDDTCMKQNNRIF